MRPRDALKGIGTLWKDFVYAVGVLTICGYAAEKAPNIYPIALAIGAIAFFARYAWVYFFQPLRETLKGAESPAEPPLGS